MSWRSLQIIVSPRGFLHENLPIFDGLSKFVMSWIDFFESYFDSSKEFSQFQVQCGWVAEHCRSWSLWKLGLYLDSSWQIQGHPSGKGRMQPFVQLSIMFWLYNALQYRSSMSSNFLVFHTLGSISSRPAAFLFLIFRRVLLAQTVLVWWFVNS